VVDGGVAPVINTGIAHREAGIGQIGAGIARAPLGCFGAAPTRAGARAGTCNDRSGRIAMAVRLAVNGTLMRGLELHPNLIDAGAVFIREARTAPVYRLWSIEDRHPAMVRVAAGGVAVAVEVWELPPEGLASILLKEPPGLSIGKVMLADGEEVLGVLAEPLVCEGQRDITVYGGWRAYRAAARA
jgi:hypothetical protein